MQIAVRSLMSLCLILLPLAATSAEPDAAVRVEGYVGYSKIDISSFDDDGFQGGGTGSASAVFDALYLQADVFGDSTDYDALGSENIGGSGHAGWRDAERGSFGIVGTYNRFGDEPFDDDLDLWRAGFEGEAFLDRITLALNSGYMQIDDDSTGYADAGIAYYPIDRVRIDLNGGLVDIEESDPIGFVTTSGEFMVADPVSVFARWEAEFVDPSGSDFEAHSIVVGARLYWGAEQPSLLAYDRAHFKRSCMGYRMIGARLC